MPPPPDALTAKLGDRHRRHYDRPDAESMVRRLDRDYGVKLRAEPCRIRRGLYHIEFALHLSELQQGVLTRYVDGYLPADFAPYYPTSTADRLGAQLSYIARESGLLSRHHTISLAVHFGIVTPTMLLEAGDFF
jgi:hypothetical protein